MADENMCIFMAETWDMPEIIFQYEEFSVFNSIYAFASSFNDIDMTMRTKIKIVYISVNNLYVKIVIFIHRPCT